MTRGLMKSTSCFAIAAAAGLFATSAMAADLGGNCCADLEERVAELEATAARKGNRKVSLTVYGNVNEAILFWDDGDKSNAYIGSPESYRTRFGFRGEAQITADVTAGYLIELGLPTPAVTNQFNQKYGKDSGDDAAFSVQLRHSAWYLDSKRLGRLHVGHTSSATDGVNHANLANTDFVASPSIFDWMGGFYLREKGADKGLAGLSKQTWSNLNPTGDIGDGARVNVIKYTTPTLAGFQASAAWGENDFWDAALRYAGEFNSVRIAAAVGYQSWTDTNLGCANGVENKVEKDAFSPQTAGDMDVDCETFAISGSIMHVPTGLYAFGAHGRVRDHERKDAFGPYGDLVKDQDKFWYVQGGIERNWFGIGKTTLYGEYYKGNYGASLKDNLPVKFAGPGSDNYDGDYITSSEVTMWGVGIVQNIDAAAMDLYLAYRHYAGDGKVMECQDGCGDPTSFKLENFDAVLAGGIIRF